MTPFPCACGCGKSVGPIRVGLFREDCARVLCQELRTLQNGPPDKLAALVTLLDDLGAHRLASSAVGALPFERR